MSTVHDREREAPAAYDETERVGGARPKSPDERGSGGGPESHASIPGWAVITSSIVETGIGSGNTAGTSAATCGGTVAENEAEATLAFERNSHRHEALATWPRALPTKDLVPGPWQQEGFEAAASQVPRWFAFLAQHGIPHVAIGTTARSGMTQTASLAKTGNEDPIRASKQSTLIRSFASRITCTIRHWQLGCVNLVTDTHRSSRPIHDNRDTEQAEDRSPAVGDIGNRTVEAPPPQQ